MNAIERIEGHHLVFEAYGRWPRFHDGYVRHFQIISQAGNSGAMIDLVIHGFEMTPQVDERGYYGSTKHHLIHFQFTGASHLEFEDLDMPDAIVGSLEFENIPSGAQDSMRLLVDLNSCYGLGGRFQCETARVMSVDPCDKHGVKLGASDL
jgi:hypothetical protein